MITYKLSSERKNSNGDFELQDILETSENIEAQLLYHLLSLLANVDDFKSKLIKLKGVSNLRGENFYIEIIKTKDKNKKIDFNYYMGHDRKSMELIRVGHFEYENGDLFKLFKTLEKKYSAK